ncbi:MAG TPA: hypothetical protein VMR28_03395 [Candidatus Saccharimonadales bacterium]|nr:hypothetical protein [Candidatus Saccharimonadales bacterium]
MIDICPTITADNAHSYRVQIEQVVSFATRLHIDIADGILAPNKLIAIDQVWWPGGLRADIHVMYQRPFSHTEVLMALRPQLIIIHAEADGGFAVFAETLHRNGIEVGVALLPATPVEVIQPAIHLIDHVLIFSGNIGHFGGHADLNLLSKVRQIKALKPTVEVGWDGGINDHNAPQLVAGGVEVLNAGGFLHGAQDPTEAYRLLRNSIGTGSVHA